MTSYSGSIAYLKYVSKTDKGGVKKGDLFNGVFALGGPHVDFTSPVVSGEEFQSAGATVDYKLAWGPVVGIPKAFINGAWVEINDSLLVKENGVVVGIVKTAFADGTKLSYKYDMEYIPADDIPTIGPKMEHIALVAEPRRIAVRYDQITA